MKIKISVFNQKSICFGSAIALVLVMVSSKSVLANGRSALAAGAIGRALAKFPELIVPYVVIAGITYALTKDPEASLGMPLLICLIIFIFQACQG